LDSFEIPHPDGKLAIKMPDEFDTTKPLRLKSKGFRNNGLGDMYVRLNVRFKK
jgi:DnaJ-class molecular chaperone